MSLHRVEKRAMSVKLQIVCRSGLKPFLLCLLLLPGLGCDGATLEGSPQLPQKLTFSVVDTTRSTPEVGNDTGREERVFDVVVWLPGTVADPDRPLLLMSHGWGGGPHKFDALATAIAA